MPMLSLVGLWHARRRFGAGAPVFIHLTPPHVKVLVRWFRIPERWILQGLSAIFGLKVVRLMPEGRNASVAAVTFQAMKATTRLLDALSSELEQAGWVGLMAEMIGWEEAAALFLRRFPWDELFLQVLALTAALRERPAMEGELSVLWSPSWPDGWLSIAERTFQPDKVRFLRWPSGYRGLAAFLLGTWWRLRAFFKVGRAVLRRRSPRPAESLPKATFAIELIDESRMGGGPNDTNYLEDGVRIRREDVVYFVAAEQLRHWRSHGRNPSVILGRLAERGFRLAVLPRLGYTARSLGELRSFAMRLIRRSGGLGPACMARSFFLGLGAFLELRLLFDNFSPSSLLFAPFPNGDAGPRFHSAIATGLCRREGIRCIGYQNRVVYDAIYEDSYDCYDLFLAWSRSWTAVLGTGARFFRDIRAVGCLDNDGLIPAAGVPSQKRLLVTIFTSEWGAAYAPPDATLRMLSTCARLAEAHPSFDFQVKTKDPEMVPKLLGDSKFRGLAERAAPNFRFLNLKRYECAPLIPTSDIVIAAAFTAPGADALLFGKRVIFYSEVPGWGRVFADFTDLVADGQAELERLFERAVSDHATYADTNAASLQKLDPFRDGRARERMIEILQPGPATPVPPRLGGVDKSKAPELGVVG